MSNQAVENNKGINSSPNSVIPNYKEHIHRKVVGNTDSHRMGTMWPYQRLNYLFF